MEEEEKVANEDQEVEVPKEEGEEDEEEEEEPVDEEEEKRELDQLMKEEDINLVAEDVDLAEIDKLTGIPKSTDLIVALVPMCAPYSAISTYKYKVKMQAGTLKRGKA